MNKPSPRYLLLLSLLFTAAATPVCAQSAPEHFTEIDHDETHCTSTIETPLGLRAEVSQTYTATHAGARDPADLVRWEEITSVNGREFSLLFDRPSLTFTSSTPEGRSASMQVDAQRRPLRVQVPGLAELEYDYDTRGRLVAVRQTDGSETREYTFAYDAFGYLSEVTDPLDRSVTITNDRDGRPTLLELPDGREIGLETDPNGNVTALTTPKQHVHRFGFDAVDRENRYEAPSLGDAATVTSTDFDTDGNPDSQSLPGGVTLDFSYDASGRLNNVSRPAQNGDAGNAVRLAYAYDGFLTTAETMTGAVAGEVRYVYDNDFRLAQLQAPGANTDYGFDDDGLLIRATTVETEAGLGGSPSTELTLERDPDHGLLLGTQAGIVSDEWTWSGFAEPRRYEARAGPSALYSADFLRDLLGRITQKTETVLGVVTRHNYRYDLAGRLDQVSINGQVSETYTYDENGNRLSLTRGPANKQAVLPSPFGRGAGGEGTPSPKTTTTYTYDPQDRLLTQGDCTYTYTPNGELNTQTCAAQTTRYSYSQHGDLIAVELPNGTQIEYIVDPRGRRVGKRINGALVQGFVYLDQLEPVAELDGNGNVIATYTYADRGHVPTLMQKGGKTYRIVSDYLGSVRLVVDVATGAVAQRMGYDAWGNVLADTIPGLQPFGFAGGVWDRDTGLVRFGARDYDPRIGKWTVKDPIDFGGGDANLFAYVGGNPISFVDPSGLTQCDIDCAITFARQNIPNQSVPSSVISMDLAPGNQGRTFHPKTPSNPNPGQFTVALNSRFWGDLNRAGLDDLFEAIIHEGEHIVQPDEMWLEGALGKDTHHGELTTRAFKTAVEYRDRYREQVKRECP